MQIVKIDRKAGWFEAIPDSFDDLWHLEKVIEPGDIVSGTTERKIKPRTEGEKAFKQLVYVELSVEKAVFHEGTNQLRIQGEVVAAKPEELVPLKVHHTLEAEVGKKIKVQKKALKQFHIDRLERAKASGGREKVLLIVMDDEEAELAFLKDTGLESRGRIIAQREGKMFKAEKGKGSAYFDELLGKISELGAQKMVVAGPGFEKQKFEKFLKEKAPKMQAVFESTNSVGITGLNELVKSGKIDEIIEGFHSVEEAKAVEKILSSVSSGLAAIGLKEVEEAVGAGAAEEIVVSENMLYSKRNETESILDKAEQYKAKVRFVDPKSDAGKQLEGMGGIAAVLRYKRNWN